MNETFEQCRKNLLRRGFEVRIAATTEEARQILREEIRAAAPETISFGGSMTMEATGIVDELRREGRYRLFDGVDYTLPPEERIEIRRQGLLADLYISGINAITEEGALYWLDGIGNRVAAIAFGPRKVLLVAGRNKIVATRAAAEARIRDIAAPRNVARLGQKTPCAATGVCADCDSEGRICNTHLRMERCFPRKRITVILIDEEMGCPSRQHRHSPEKRYDMAKVKKAFFCRNCGFEAPKWLGRCPSCGEWNTFTEEVIARESGGGPTTVANLPKARPQRIADIHESEHRRIDLGNREVNRVLGGGLVPGSLVLLGGEPGIGKSTLSLQIALADNGLKTLYVSGEESAEQIKMRALRLGIGNEGCLIYAETLLENILAQIEEQRPDLVVIDSIQTIYTDIIESSAGSVSQIRECAASLLKYAKATGTSIFIIGHITKDGTIAGPKILEHIVDVVLQFEGDNNLIYRILRGIKNRFGATFEIGVFEMLDAGLREVDNPSEILLSHYETPLSGIAVGASVDGIRPYLIEVQALVSNAAYGTPQRTATGYDNKRMNMLLAVLEKRVGMKMFSKDVFLNFAGGFKVADPGLDLAVTAAVISSYYDRPIGEGICLAGEIGLSGEVRPAPRTEQRISEAARLGFRRIVVSGYLGRSIKKPKGIEIVTINSIDQLPRALFAEG
jgi:DNA repair protein RadA/Sms